MLTVSDVSLQFDGVDLFKHVDLKFTDGNCYGIIGANGAGKSTLLRILSGDLEPSTGAVAMGVGAAKRLSSVNWSVVKEMTLAWVLTFPGCGVIGWLMAKIFMAIF